ncbi:MAG TPA: polysaccharide biosynthesis/export family protein [Bryobacteraceae bacterium]|nr:polysaccharide biosynthesis/export family protein [Bryobacteraceae bacterium]
MIRIQTRLFCLSPRVPTLFFLLALTLAAAFAQPHAPVMTDAGKANLPQQPIGPSDLIAVSVYDAPELTRSIRVDAEGQIRLPLLQAPIPASGLLPKQLESRIVDALKEEQILVDPVVSVTIVEYYSRPISVAGAVRKPITFQATGNVTLLEAIARAEGLSDGAGTEILVSLPQELVRRIPVKALIDGADPEMNLRLAGGEEIRVPEASRIYVVGNVKRPGVFPLRDAADTSVLKVLALAEGLTQYSARQAYIYRRAPDGAGKKEIEIEIEKIMKRKAPDVPLLADDILYIPDNSGRRAALSVLEKVVMFGSGAGAAAIYGSVR